MPDQFTHVVKRGYGSRIWESIKGIFIGFLLFVVSFGVLYWNEGRVDLSKVAETAIEISAQSVDEMADKQLVSVSGEVTTDEIFGDDLYMNPGNYMALKRTVEMYAWVEQTETETEEHLGGSETETTTYTYEKEWAETPDDSTSFKHPEDHENPEMLLESEVFAAKSASIGVYSIKPSNIKLPGFQPIELTEEMITLPESELVELADSDYLFDGYGTLANPEIGDIRISYSMVPAVFDGTVFGKLNGNKIEPYITEEARLYRAFYGTRDEAIVTLATEHKMITWILRLVGFLLMWVGLGMILGPISVVMGVVPFFGRVSRGAISAATFIVALVLSVTTILVSMVFHSLIALLVIAGITALGLFYVFKIKKQDAES
jgi:hypothetical protein